MIQLQFTAPTVPLSANKAIRGRGRLTYRQARPWKSMVTQLLVENRAGWHLLDTSGGIMVDLVLPFRERRTRDPHNYMLVMKAVVDGIVRSGLIPGDDPRYVSTLEPTLVVDPDLQAVLTLTPRPLRHPVSPDTVPPTTPHH